MLAKTLIVIAVIILFTIPVIPTFWAILDIPKRRFASEKKKMLWIFLVATLPFFGAILYILFARRHTEPAEIS